MAARQSHDLKAGEISDNSAPGGGSQRPEDDRSESTRQADRHQELRHGTGQLRAGAQGQAVADPPPDPPEECGHRQDPVLPGGDGARQVSCH